MSQTAPVPSVETIAAVAPSPRVARFGVALIAIVLVSCFGILIAARERPVAMPSAGAVAETIR